MNWRRGSLRAWLAFSSVWILVFAYLSWNSYSCGISFHAMGRSEYEDMRSRYADAERAPEWHQGGLNKRYYNNEAHEAANRAAEYHQYGLVCDNDFDRWLTLLFSVPTALAALYFIVLWVTRGFKPQ